MKHFQEKEFVCKCCGRLPADEHENMEALVDNVLDPARERYGKPTKVNSGYRCPKHNAEVGGARASQHLRGEAADITCVGLTGREMWEENLEIVRAIIKNGVWDQMILEEVHDGDVAPKWVHVSFKRTGTNRREVIKKKCGLKGYYPLSRLDWEQINSD